MSTTNCRILGGSAAALGLLALAYGVTHALGTTVPYATLGRVTASIMMLGLLLVLGGGMTLLGHRH